MATLTPQVQQQQPRQTGRKTTLVPIAGTASVRSPTTTTTLLVEVAAAQSPAPPDSGLGTPCISSASTDSSGGSSGRRRRANQPLRVSSSDEDSAEDTSSCASSSTYQRVAGFRDHAHAHPVVRGRAKEKRALLAAGGQGQHQHQPLPAVVAAASVPMRSRHLPKSMWQEPDVANYSPANTVLPRLALHRSVDDVSELGLSSSGLSTASPFKAGGGPRSSLKPPIRTVLNLDPSEALQRRLFEVALKVASPEQQQLQQQKKRPMERLQPIAQRPPVASKSSFVSNNDPCLSDCNRFPYLARGGGGAGLAAAVHAAESLEALQQQQQHQHQLGSQLRDSPSQLLGEVAKHL